MKRLISLLVLLTLIVTLFSCYSQEEDELDDLLFDEFLDGMEQAEENVFLQLYKSDPSHQKLTRGVKWAEDDFEFIIRAEFVDNKTNIYTSLSIPNTTLEMALENLNAYVAIYGLKKGYTSSDINAWDELCGDFETYLLYSPTDFQSKKIKSDFTSYYELEYIAVVIAINGSLYTGKYLM
jgi:hypothetical protein